MLTLQRPQLDPDWTPNGAQNDADKTTLDPHWTPTEHQLDLKIDQKTTRQRLYLGLTWFPTNKTLVL